MKDILLWLVSILLLWLLYIPALITKAGVSIANKEFNTNWFRRMALSNDQKGNVVSDDLFNMVLITEDSKHRFGNEDETISSVLGKNKLDKTLKKMGIFLVWVLNALDKNHSLKSIEE